MTAFVTIEAGELTLEGGAVSGEQALIRDASGNIMLATGTTVPTNDTAGYAKGCLFIDTDVAKGTTGLNCNKGTAAECTFTAVTQT